MLNLLITMVERLVPGSFMLVMVITYILNAPIVFGLSMTTLLRRIA